MTQALNASQLSAEGRLAEITFTAILTLKTIAEGHAEPDPATLAAVVLGQISAAGQKAGEVPPA